MKRFSSGFSLMEMIVVIGLVSVLSLLLSLIISRGFNSYRFSRESIEAQDEIALAMRDFEKKTRGATEIIMAGQYDLTFYVYLGDETCPAPSYVHYFLSGDELQRGIISPVQTGPDITYPPENEVNKTIAKFIVVTLPIFDYYDDSSQIMQFPIYIDSIKMIRITISSDEDINKPPLPITETTTVNLRNLKKNL